MAEAVTAEPPPLARPQILRQRWLNVSFAHWAVDPSTVAHLYPSGTAPDIFEGRTYVGLVAFEMSGKFLETNVRLYSVDETGRRGVFFLSLDANRLDFVIAARTVVGVPYRWARMSYRQASRRHAYTSIVRWPNVTAASRLDVAVGDPLTPGALEHFLTARWGAHVARIGRTWYVPTSHPAWPLRTAELVGFEDDGLFASVGLGGLGTRAPDHVVFSDGVPAQFGLPVPATRPRRYPVGLSQGASGGRASGHGTSGGSR